MFESVCALLLRLYPPGFRRAYGPEAIELIRDRARHERGVFLRTRLLLDLAIDLGATALHGWQPSTPVLARVDGRPRLEVIESHSPRLEALAGGMVASLLVFAAFTLLFQPKAPLDALAYLSERSGFEMPGAGSIDSTRHTGAADRDPHHERIAAVAANRSKRDVDKPEYALTSSRTQSSTEYSVYTFRMLKRATGVREATAPDNPYPVKVWEFVGKGPDVRASRTDAYEAAKALVETRLLALPAAQTQAFEAISIRPSRSADPRDMRMRVMPNGDLNASALAVPWLMRYAYDVPFSRLSGLPRFRESFDIEAKAPANAVPPSLPERERQRRAREMIRGLLADRFKLVMRVEQKTLPVYALAVASGGPNLQKSAIAEKDCVFDTGAADSCHTFVAGRGHPLTAPAVDMDDLAQYLENWADRPVVNRTGLRGLFAVDAGGWRPMRLPPPPPSGNPPGFAGFDDLPTIFEVLGTLGLELIQEEATVPVYTVERIERPSAE